GCGGSDPARYTALFMPKVSPLLVYFIAMFGCALLATSAAQGQMVTSAKQKFIFRDADGKTDSAEIVTKYAPKKIVHPVAKADPSISSKLMRAATIAEER